MNYKASNDLVFHNSFAEMARSNILSKNAQKLEAYIITNIDTYSTKEKPFPEIVITREILKKLKLSAKSRNNPKIDKEKVKKTISRGIARDMRETFIELMNLKIKVPLENGNDWFGPLCAGVELLADGESYKLSFHQNLSPIFRELKDHFTKVAFPIVLGIEKCDYSYDLYKYLKMKYDSESYKLKMQKKQSDVVKFVVDLSIIRGFLGLDNQEDPKQSIYVKTPEFNRSVLKPAAKELSEITDLNVKYRGIRGAGNKIVQYEFTVYKQAYTPQFDWDYDDDSTTAEKLEEDSIPTSVIDVLNELSFKPVGKSKDFIISHLRDTNEETLIKVLAQISKDFQGQSDKVRGGVVKSVLPIYMAKEIAQKTKLQEIDAIKIETGRKEKVLDSWKKKFNSAFEEFELLHPAKLKEVKDELERDFNGVVPTGVLNDSLISRGLLEIESEVDYLKKFL